MKTLVIPLVEKPKHMFDIFDPELKFEEKWCLDLYGFLSRDDFSKQLDEINKAIVGYPLLSERAKKYLTWGLVALFVFVTVMCFLAPSSFGVGASINTFIVSGIIISRKAVDVIAETRAVNFTNRMEFLLNQLNKHNPVANWHLAWCRFISHYEISSKESTMTPKYADKAELVLQIHDSLSSFDSITKDVKEKLNELNKEGLSVIRLNSEIVANNQVVTPNNTNNTGYMMQENNAVPRFMTQEITTVTQENQVSVPIYTGVMTSTPSSAPMQSNTNDSTPLCP